VPFLNALADHFLNPTIGWSGRIHSRLKAKVEQNNPLDFKRLLMCGRLGYEIHYFGLDHGATKEMNLTGVEKGGILQASRLINREVIRIRAFTLPKTHLETIILISVEL
jgi:hypothetical protein